MPRKTTYKDRLTRIQAIKDAKKPLGQSGVTIYLTSDETEPVNFCEWFNEQISRVPDKVVPVRAKASTALPPGAIALKDSLSDSTSAQVLIGLNGEPIYAIPSPTPPAAPIPKRRMPWDRDTTARDRPWN